MEKIATVAEITSLSNSVDTQLTETSNQFQNKLDTRDEEFNSKVDLATIDTQIGTSVQSKVADDSVVELKIEGATTVTPANPDLDISPDNVATITSAKDFDVVAENEDATQSNKLTITKELNKLENGVADTRERIDDKYVKYTQRIGRSVFDGSPDEIWEYVTTTGVNQFAIPINNLLFDSTLLCNIFKISQFGLRKDNYNTIYTYTDNKLRINLSTLIATNVVDFKTFLQANPITVLYELAEPIETIVEEPSTLTSYKGVANVFTTATAQPKLTVDFKSRLKNTTEILLAEIAKLKQAIISLGGTV